MIVVAYGKQTLLAECLQSLDVALDAVEGSTELIVVLNDATSATRRELEGAARERVLVDPGRNLGFAGGVMAGIERAQGEWIALVNDDCIVAPPALAELLAAGDASPDIGSVAATVVFADRDVINSAGIEVDELGVAYERLLGEHVNAVGDDIVDIFGASGAGALYRRAMLDQLGGFDTSFFAYLEDADLAWRARMQGWRCVHQPRAVVAHRHSASLGHRSPEKHFLVGRNRVRMLAKNASQVQLARNSIRICLYDAAYIAFTAATSHTLAPLWGRVRGLLEWRRYRLGGAGSRGPITLVPSRGVRDALRRNGVYRSIRV